MSTLESSASAFQRTKLSVGAGVSSGLRAAMRPHPLFVERGHGSKVWDLDGTEYLDYVMGWGPLIAGHSNPEILAAVTETMSRMQMVGMGHRLEYEAAELVLTNVPGAERLLWSNTGTEAVQIALRLARAATGRNAVVKFTHSYHGWHDSVYASVGRHDGGEAATINSAGQNPHAIQDLIVLPFNDIEAVRRVVHDADARNIAAVLIDPIMSNAGVFTPAPGFLETLRELCDRHGVVLIFDQVITGFRIALGGASELYSVIPDLSTFGKAIAGGFPQSAVVGRADLIDLVDRDVVHAGTYNGNPISLAAVATTQQILSRPGTYARLESVSRRLHEQLQRVLDDIPGRPTIRRVGSLLQFVEPISDGSPDIWPRLSEELLRRHVVVLPGGKIFVSTAHTEDDVDRTVEAFSAALTSIQSTLA